MDPVLERPAPPDVIELLELRLDRDAVFLEVHMDALRAKEGALSRRLAEPAERPAAFLAFGRIPAPLLPRPVEKKSGADREKNRPEQGHAEINREGGPREAREAESVPPESPGPRARRELVPPGASGRPRSSGTSRRRAGRGCTAPRCCAHRVSALPGSPPVRSRGRRPRTGCCRD